MITTADGTSLILGIASNVTQFHQVNRELQQAKEKAEQSDKLKSAFLANMSHEIRTPLNAIVGFSQLLPTCETDDERNEYINIINKNNELLLRLIGDILDLSKLESGTVEHNLVEYDMAEYFREIATTMQQRMTNPHVRFIVDSPYEHCILRGDKGRFAQLMNNYMTNAIKYTPEGYIKMGYRYTGGVLTTYVEDSGIGIAESKKSRIFRRFEKLDEFAQGTGLGLSICKAIVEACGGKVGFESTEGKGSTFWASWQMEAKITEHDDKAIVPPVEQSSEKPAVAVESPESLSILVAEDNDSNYLLVKAILKKYTLTRANNGATAVDLAGKNPYDVILMDMKMPVMGGIEATRRIRHFDRRTPIIALTANAFDTDRKEAIEAGCNAFMPKPLNRQELEKLLVQLRKRRRPVEEE